MGGHMVDGEAGHRVGAFVVDSGHGWCAEGNELKL